LVRVKYFLFTKLCLLFCFLLPEFLFKMALYWKKLVPLSVSVSLVKSLVISDASDVTELEATEVWLGCLRLAMVGLAWLSVGCINDGCGGSSDGGAATIGLLNRESKSDTLCSSTTISELPAFVDGAVWSSARDADGWRSSCAMSTEMPPTRVTAIDHRWLNRMLIKRENDYFFSSVSLQPNSRKTRPKMPVILV